MALEAAVAARASHTSSPLLSDAGSDTAGGEDSAEDDSEESSRLRSELAQLETEYDALNKSLNLSAHLIETDLDAGSEMEEDAGHSDGTGGPTGKTPSHEEADLSAAEHLQSEEEHARLAEELALWERLATLPPDHPDSRALGATLIDSSPTSAGAEEVGGAPHESTTPEPAWASFDDFDHLYQEHLEAQGTNVVLREKIDSLELAYNNACDQIVALRRSADTAQVVQVCSLTRGGEREMTEGLALSISLAIKRWQSLVSRGCSCISF